MHVRFAHALLPLLCAAPLLAGGGGPGQHDIVDTAVSAGSFKTLAAALGAADLIGALKAEGPFTVFAPTDDAFGELPEKTIKALLRPENRATLSSILTYHVVPGRLLAKDVVQLRNATSLNGQRVDIRVEGGVVQVDGARVVKTDIECSNGVIHVIDGVLMPKQDSIIKVADNAGIFGTLLKAGQAAGLRNALDEGEFTVFAPTDAAFAKIDKKTIRSLLEPKNRDQLAAILKYHVVPGRVYADQAATAGRAGTLQGSDVALGIRGGRLRVNDVAIIDNDIEARNGVIHVIDEVLMPPAPAKPRGRKFFGLSYEKPSAALAAQLNLDRQNSLVVTKVVAASQAAAAGLKKYDVITAVAGRPATDANLTRAKKEGDYGDAVEFRLVRGGKHVQLPVEIGEERH